MATAKATERHDNIEAFASTHLVPALRTKGWWGPGQVVCDYCKGLLLPGDRKSMEPIAARLDPEHVQGKHASIQRFITDSKWDHRVLLRAAREATLPFLLAQGGLEGWLVDDTSFPKRGRCSVGVANQYCGERGIVTNCQSVVTVNLANQQSSLPTAYHLFLPQEWTKSAERRRLTGIPSDITFQSKPEIAIQLIDQLIAEDTPAAPIVADAGYGDSGVFRKALEDRGLSFMVGIRSSILMWKGGQGPLPPVESHSGRGRRSTRPRLDPKQPPIPVMDLAKALPCDAWQIVEWREGSRGPMRSRFAACRGLVPGPMVSKTRYAFIHPEQWLLVEWPEDEPEPIRFWLSNFPPRTQLLALVRLAKLRWRIEQDYEELKGELGLGHFEGRTWAGFHHHGACCLAAYAFLVAERARVFPPTIRELLGSPEPPFPKTRSWRTSPYPPRTP